MGVIRFVGWIGLGFCAAYTALIVEQAVHHENKRRTTTFEEHEQAFTPDGDDVFGDPPESAAWS